VTKPAQHQVLKATAPLLEAAGIEPATRRKQNPKQVALLPANALISHRIVPPLRPVSSRLVPFNSPLEGHTGGTCSLLPTVIYPQVATHARGTSSGGQSRSWKKRACRL
jgi:hypothetical protein